MMGSMRDWICRPTLYLVRHEDGNLAFSLFSVKHRDSLLLDVTLYSSESLLSLESICEWKLNSLAWIDFALSPVIPALAVHCISKPLMRIVMNVLSVVVR